MSLFGNSVLAGSAGQGPSADLGDTIEQSLRFTGTQNLTRTMAAGAETTFSCWVKIANLSGSGMAFIGATSGTNYVNLFWEGVTYETLGADNSNTSYAYTSNKLRDPSAWYHLVYVRSSSDTKVYINGAEASYRLSSTGSNGALSSTTFGIGSLNNGTSKFQGYMADVYFVESVKQPSDFGRYQEDGVWVPKNYTGTYGTNGFHLTFDSSQTNGIGHDSSGNGNNWTATGFETTAISSSNTDNDVDFLDTPTSNYATFNPLYPYPTAVLSKANLRVDDSNGGYAPQMLSTIKLDGKYYWEVIPTTNSSYPYIGVTVLDPTLTSNTVFADSCYIDSLGNGGNFGSSISNNTYSTGDVIGVAYDSSNRQITFTYNGANSQSFTVGGTDELAPMVASAINAGANINFGQMPFIYTPPAGFSALQTNNLPEPEIKNSKDHFDVLTWTGDGASPKTRTGLEFTPDLIWIKERNQAYSIGHRLYDSVRGAGVNKHLNSSSTAAEGSGNDEDYGYVTGFVEGGFTTINGTSGSDYVNNSSNNYVAWCWKAGGTAVSNTDGTITSSVSANTDAGFSIVSYNGTGANATVGHGLNSAPEMIIFKNRDVSTFWPVYHKDIASPTTQYLVLQDIDNNQPNATILNSTAPGSSVFNVGASGASNASGNKMIAYCWHSVPGYSAFGGYTGNSNADGPFVYTGFRPAFILYKCSSHSSNWHIRDSSRNVYNPANSALYPNLSNIETANSGNDVDLLSNGFKIRNGDGDQNTTGRTWIWAAFAENPFGGENAPPATAR